MAQRSLNRRSRSRDEDEDYTEPDRGRDEDQDEEPPRRGRGRSRRDEDEQDEAPRGRRSRRDSDEDEDEAPRGRRSRSRDEDEDDEPRSRRSSRRDEDEEPRERAPRNTAKGWGGMKAKRAETSDWIKNYAVSDVQEEIVKYLEDEPFSVYNEHWLDELPKGKKKSYVCIGVDCPLCAIGDRAKTYVLFNVLDLRDAGNPTVFPFRASPQVAEVLEDYANDKKTGPLSREDIYFAVKKTGGGKKGPVRTHITPVKARDLEEDWDITPFTQAELDDFTLYTEDDVLEFHSRKSLKAVAELLED